MNNEQVCKYWMLGKSASSLHMMTDGENLFSYNLVIGHTTPNNKKIIKDYTSKGGNFVSATTSHHVSMATRYADEVENPY